TWIRLLCLAAELNDGGEIYVIKDSPLSIEDISAMLGIDEALAAEALGVFRDLGMITFADDGILTVKNWSEYQGGEKKKPSAKVKAEESSAATEAERERARERKRLSRERQKAAGLIEAKNKAAEAAESLSGDESGDASPKRSKADVTDGHNTVTNSVTTEMSRGDGLRPLPPILQASPARSQPNVTNVTTNVTADVTANVTDCHRNVTANVTDIPIYNIREDKNRSDEIRGEREEILVTCDLGDSRSASAEGESPSSPSPSKKKYGRFLNVFLSDGDYAALKGEYGELIDRTIDELSSYMKSMGKSYEDHFATLYRWALNSITREKSARESSEGSYRGRGAPAAKSPKPRYGDFDPEEAMRRAIERTFSS
ncbi:MAG: phage replisome organizer N-terminal domain-containing protein, partial [Clostridia bacterium]|nr:phage replisome organizer N-terminal domain-containing protein [Clostridia bacterium]